jgi:hypothetical protein
MSDHNTLLNRLRGTLGIEEAAAAFEQLFEIPVVLTLAADGAAGTTIAATKWWSNPFDYPVQIVSFEVNPDASVTGDATNIGTITLTVDDGANGAPATAAEITTDTDAPGEGSWSADVDETGRLTAANCIVNAGANIFYAQTKGGTGVQLPARALKLRLRRI